MAMETAQSALNVFAGTKEAGGKLFADLRRMSATSPINIDSYSQSAQTLLSYGAAVETVVPSLTMLSNIAGGDQERFKRLSFAFGQVTAAASCRAMNCGN